MNRRQPLVLVLLLRRVPCIVLIAFFPTRLVTTSPIFLVLVVLILRYMLIVEWTKEALSHCCQISDILD
jgi:hypothetical protein